MILPARDGASDFRPREQVSNYDFSEEIGSERQSHLPKVIELQVGQT